MPTEENTNQSRSINKKIDILGKKMDSLYKDIYISRPDNKQNLDTIVDRIDDVIDKLQGSDYSVSGMTELLRRVDSSKSSNTSKLISSVQDLFSDQNVIGSIFANEDIHQFIKAQNNNFDLICKYLPRLQDALEIKRDNVLSSDNFSKDFLNPISVRSSKEESEKFNSNVERIEKEYEMSDFLEETYMRTSKYGEDFIYIVPYHIAFERLFKKANLRLNSSRVGQVSLFEGYSTVEGLPDNFGETREFKSYITNMNKEGYISESVEEFMKGMPQMHKINIHVNRSNTINTAVSEYCILSEKMQLESFKSLSEVFKESAVQQEAINNKTGLSSMFDNVVSQNAKFNKKIKGLGVNDGLVVNNLDRDPSKLDKNLLGAVLERIPRENIVPIYIGKKCLGYYYLEFAEDPNACGFCGGHHTNPAAPAGGVNRFSYDMTERQEELTIRYISSRISQVIDANFINTNKDLKEEIYQILRYNEKFDAARTNDIGVTFIPAEDIVHTYFKLDEHTHRGISDLQRAVVPAMLYILLYLTDIIGKITRSTDKRIYYVKQNVETNVARTMMNVVAQIKKGNMGMRQIESMNNILNIVGKYNDFIVPQNAAGDSPIQFEVMQGQNIETPTDIMDKMEESAVNTIMPYELVNATYQQDFATKYTMSNTRLLKNIITVQRKTEAFFSKIYTPVYNYEFNDNLPEIKIVLPPPTYLITNNNSQLIDNINQLADKIVDVELVDESDEVKAEFKKLYLRENLGTYINFNLVEKLRVLAKVNIETNKTPSTEEANDDVNDVMNDEF